MVSCTVLPDFLVSQRAMMEFSETTLRSEVLPSRTLGGSPSALPCLLGLQPLTESRVSSVKVMNAVLFFFQASVFAISIIGKTAQPYVLQGECWKR